VSIRLPPLVNAKTVIAPINIKGKYLMSVLTLGIYFL